MAKLLFFAALAFVLVEIVQARARVSLSVWALLCVTVALLLPLF